jgi:hypothetical protein
MGTDDDARRLRRYDEARGRKIGLISYDGVSIGLKFTDGTYWFASADAQCGCCDTRVCLEDTADLTPAQRFALGLIDRAELERAWAAKQEKLQARERAEYERLRAKFEGSADATTTTSNREN